ncbi:MAG: MG2 domain-containing protein, partial [Myxococcota bacterium]|nr:MG2 domain-containing protein [Myxococcota bacterium]
MRPFHPILFASVITLLGCDYLPTLSNDGKSADESSVSRGLPIILAAQPVGRTSTRNISIQFSEPIVSASLVGKELSDNLPVSISPSLAGTGMWVDNSNFVYRPSEQFRRSAKYKVVLDESVLGTEIDGDKEFSFNTRLFALRSVETFVRNPNNNIRVNLDFNYEIDPNTIGANVRFETVDGQLQPYSLTTKKVSRNIAAEIQLTPNALAGRELRVHIKPELTCVDCGGSLGKKIIRTVTVNRVSPLKVKSVSSHQRNTEFTIDLRFNTQVDPQTASEFVSVVPAVKYTLVKIHRGLRLVGSFAAGNGYAVNVKSGLMGLDGRTLDTAFSKSVVIPDFEPKLSFVGQGNYIQKHGKQTLNIRSINVRGMRISVRKIHSNNLVHVVPELGGSNNDDEEHDYYGYSRVNTASFGPVLFSGEVPVDYVKNKPVISSIPFQQIQSQELNGVYLVEIRDKDRSWTSSRRYMLATDIGMTLKVGRNENHVQLISLKTKRPIPNAIVKFYSRTNEIYGTRMTNQNGVAILSGRKRESLGVITAQRGNDFSYLSLRANEVSVTDFDVGGAARSKGAYEAYIYSDRGLYRPGDKARVTAIVRKPNLESPPNLPLQLEIRDPKMRLFLSTRQDTEKDGIFTSELSFPQDALTGDYSVSLMTPDGRTIGREKLQVEEFMPQRLKVAVTPQAKSVSFSEPINFDVESSFLFGAPASGLVSTAQCLYNETSIRSPSYRSFRFSNYAASEKLSRLNDRKNLNEVELDSEGKTMRTCEFGRQEKPRGPIRVSLVASVRETGGRAVTARSSGLIHPYETYVGIRQNTDLSYTMVGEDTRLEALVVDRDGKPKAGQKIAVVIERQNWKSVLKFVNGRYRYVSESTFAVVEEKEILSALSPVSLLFVPKVAARYRISIRDKKTGAESAQEIRVSGYGNDQVEMSNPDVLSMTLDKPDYRPGDSAKVMIRAPFTGTLILTVERDTVLWTKTIPLDGNLATLSVPVTNNMLPNAFLSGQLIRGKESPEKMAPMRAYGVVPIKLAASQHRLGLTLKAPKVMKP